MSTTNGGAADAGAQAEAAQPQLNVLAQYVKDLSFENPNAPRSLQQQQAQPSINIQINVNAKPLAANEYEIELKIEGRAEIPGVNLFLFGFDLLYAGVFRITNVPQENLHPIIMIECPRLLFPFARELIATAVRNGGFPPLMIDPVDFVSLYRQKVAESQPQPGPATA
jgi:preprotein translocase subunit SecB